MLLRSNGRAGALHRDRGYDSQSCGVAHRHAIEGKFDLEGDPIDPRSRRVYLERTIHSEIYRAIYAELNARVQSEAMRLGTITYQNIICPPSA